MAIKLTKVELTNPPKITLHKATAREFAKNVLADQIFLGLEYWQESFVNEFALMTDREKQLVNEQMQKVANMLLPKLGYKKLELSQ